MSLSVAPIPGRTLTPAERQVLEQIATFGITVLESVSRLPALAPGLVRDARRLLAKLTRRRLIQQRPLYRSRPYYTLTEPGVALMQALGRKPCLDSRPLSEESKIRAFAMLSFCCLGESLRKPELIVDPNNRLARYSNFYLDDSLEPRHGFLRIDMGGRGCWDRVLAKCEHDVQSIRDNPRFLDAVTSGRAEVSLAVTLPHKAERLRQALSDRPLVLPIRIVVIPELLYLIAPPPEP